MTLETWVKQGNAMLSHVTTAGCCIEAGGINERMLRKMELRDIYAIPGWGEVARREHARWKEDADG